MLNSCFHKQVITANDYKPTQSAEGQQAASHLNYNHSLPKRILITVQSSDHSRLNAAAVIWGMKAERREDRPLSETLGLGNAGRPSAAGGRRLTASTQLCCCNTTASLATSVVLQRRHHGAQKSNGETKC